MRTLSNKGCQIIELDGNIQQIQMDGLEKALESCHTRRQYQVIVDLANVVHICSSALGLLVSYKRLYKQEKGDLQLVITDENLLKLFEITMLNKVFEISSTQKDAIEKFD